MNAKEKEFECDHCIINFECHGSCKILIFNSIENDENNKNEVNERNNNTIN